MHASYLRDVESLSLKLLVQLALSSPGNLAVLYSLTLSTLLAHFVHG